MKPKYIAPILLLFLSACSAKETRPAEDEFFVTVEVSTPVKGAVVEYSLGGEPQGGQELTDARGGLFEEGERLRFVLSRKSFEFPERLTDEKFGAYFMVYDENGGVFLAETPESFQSAVFSLSDDGWEWQADFGSEYVFTLDETENGYIIYPAQ